MKYDLYKRLNFWSNIWLYIKECTPVCNMQCGQLRFLSKIYEINVYMTMHQGDAHSNNPLLISSIYPALFHDFGTPALIKTKQNKMLNTNAYGGLSTKEIACVI